MAAIICNLDFIYLWQLVAINTKFGNLILICVEVFLINSPSTLVYSTNKSDCDVITEILLKVALNIIPQT
jgi:hypothetical protein